MSRRAVIKPITLLSHGNTTDNEREKKHLLKLFIVVLAPTLYAVIRTLSGSKHAPDKDLTYPLSHVHTLLF